MYNKNFLWVNSGQSFLFKNFTSLTLGYFFPSVSLRTGGQTLPPNGLNQTKSMYRILYAMGSEMGPILDGEEAFPWGPPMQPSYPGCLGGSQDSAVMLTTSSYVQPRREMGHKELLC